MKNIIKKFCEDKSLDNGLLLLDMPTGFGKTHNVLDYIFEISTNPNFDKKIFFVTTLKKNLPEKELEQRFIDNGFANEFKEKYIFLDSNADTVIKKLTNDIRANIPNDIKKTDEYKRLNTDAIFIQKCNDNKFTDKSLYNRVFDDFRMKTEPAFRRYISNLLSSKYKTINEKLYAIKTSKDWQWLGELYPAVFTRDKQIIFLSADKFISRNTTIVEPSYMFYNNDILKNALVFIDEFDAVKETMLKSIISNSIKDKIDFLELFKEIYSALHTTEFPTDMTKMSKERAKSEYVKNDPKNVVENIKNESEKIYNEYKLQYNHKTINTDFYSNGFLFQDHRFQTIVNGNKDFITTQYNSSQKINQIDFVKEKPESNENNIFNLLGRLRGFISYFQGSVNILAYNYLELKQENRTDGEDEFTREAAIRTILNEFHLNSKYVDYLTSSILISSYKNRDSIEKSSIYDLSLYEKGFRYYSFINDVNHDMQSKIMMCNFTSTPEKLLLRFCEKAKIIGISATATLPTVIGNFDLDYLKLKLQDKYRTVSKEDNERLKQEFQNNCQGYKEIKIGTKLISGRDALGKYTANIWKDVFIDEELANYAFNTVEQLGVEDYYKIRYVRICKVFKEFVMHKDIQSFLCMLTAHPKEDTHLSKKVLFDIFDKISSEHINSVPSGFRVNDNVVLLNGDEFDEKKNDLSQKLQKGKKLFVISVYQTIGAGQNLQYKISKNEEKKLIKINSFKSRNEKDFDAIYLDRPTNIITNLTNSISEEDFVKYIFQHEFLQQNGEISQEVNKKHIYRAFEYFTTQTPYNLKFAESSYQCKSCKLYATRTLIQAIGRICRTNLKSKTIYIFADEDINDVIDFSVGNRLLNREFIALLDCFKSKGEDIKNERIQYLADLKSNKSNNFIKNYLINNWNLNSIKEWHNLRSTVLINPTIDKKSVEQSVFLNNFYIELPCQNNVLFYSQESDYKYTHISFVKDKKFIQEISQDDARLNQFMSIPRIKKCFEERGWATEFKLNDFIMTPATYNNIYKGALGEVVGWLVFKEFLYIKLDEIRDVNLFELFDYSYNNNIYIDFKHWKNSFDQDNNQILRKIDDKLKKSSGKAAFIINMFSKRDLHPRKKVVSNGTIYIIPSLLSNEKPNTEALEYIRGAINELSD